jgi:hypothetical protein
MTPWQYSLLCQLAYYDFPAGSGALGRTAAELARSLLDTEGELPPYGRQPMMDIVRDPAVGPMTLIAEEVDLTQPGFAAYAFASPEEGKVVAMRPTESHTSLSGLMDWTDNFMAPLVGSTQYESVERFVNRFPDGRLVLTGHSKGAHNAMYGLAVAENNSATCVCFDGQGFARCQLTQPQKLRLARNAVNYVTQRDPVGALCIIRKARLRAAVLRTRPRAFVHGV